MNSPITTVIKNKTGRKFIINPVNGVRITLEGFGQATVRGDIFTRATSELQIATIVGLMKDGYIDISYTIDQYFLKHAVTADEALLTLNATQKDWYKELNGKATLPEAVEAKKVVKEEPKVVEEAKAPVIEEEVVETKEDTATVVTEEEVVEQEDTPKKAKTRKRNIKID